MSVRRLFKVIVWVCWCGAVRVPAQCFSCWVVFMYLSVNIFVKSSSCLWKSFRYFMWRTYVCFTLCKVVCNEPRTAWIWYICRTVQHMWRLQLNVCSNVWVLLYRIYLYIYVYADLGSAVWQLKCNKLFAYRCFLSVCVLCVAALLRDTFSLFSLLPGFVLY